MNQKRFWRRATVKSDKLPGQPTRGSHGNLLAQHGPHRDLESVPSSGGPQPGTLRYQPGKHRIAGQMVADGLDVRAQIEQPPHPRNDGGQQPDIRKADADTQTLPLRQVGYFNTSHGSIDLHRAQVASALHDFNARNGTRPQEGEYALPVIGRTVAKPKGDVFLSLPRRVLSTQSARRTMKQPEKCFVEPPQAAEARRHGHIGHRHPCLVDKLLREQHPPRLRHGNRRRPEMLKKQASQLAFAQAQTSGKLFNAVAVAIERALGDQSQGAGNSIRGPAPRSKIGGRFRPAAKTRTKPGILGRRR